MHRFLARHAFYPLVLSSLLAFGIYAGRAVISHEWRVYASLVWNLFLAWLPYLFSLWAVALDVLFPKRWWLLLIPGALWLLFFPNAAYIVTDFLHLKERPLIPLWFDIILMISFAWTGLFLSIASLRNMQILAKKYVGAILSWLFVTVAIGLNGLGMYLGRFERWNSWDFFFHPRHIVADIAVRFKEPFENLRFFGFTFLFTAFLLVCYLTFVSVSQMGEPPPERT